MPAIRFSYRGWLLDLDGTVYRGEKLIDGAVEVVSALRGAGRCGAFLSNKPIQTRSEYAAKLSRLGIPTAAEEVVNSSLVLARHLGRLDPGAPGFVIGEPPLIGELEAHGFEVRQDDRVRWVMIAAVEAVTGKRVELVVGKPSPLMLEVALAVLGLPAAETAIVGDRIETDVVMGKALGLATVLVLSGVTVPGDPRIAELGPDHVLASIRELIQ